MGGSTGPPPWGYPQRPRGSPSGGGGWPFFSAQSAKIFDLKTTPKIDPPPNPPPWGGGTPWARRGTPPPVFQNSPLPSPINPPSEWLPTPPIDAPWTFFFVRTPGASQGLWGHLAARPLLLSCALTPCHVPPPPPTPRCVGGHCPSHHTTDATAFRFPPEGQIWLFSSCCKRGCAVQSPVKWTLRSCDEALMVRMYGCVARVAPCVFFTTM